MRRIFLIALVTLLCAQYPLKAQFPVDTNPQDSLELVKLYYATDGPNWTNKNGWLTNVPAFYWDGVHVSNTGSDAGRVISIDLHNRNLSGSIPDLNFPAMTEINLSYNNLSGNVPAFDNCPNMINLILQNNRLTGSIPLFSNLLKLEMLRLESNQLSGNIPEFNNLTRLRFLLLHRNLLTGSIPDFNLPLSTLALTNNQLTGSLPAFAKTKLMYLSLDSNQLTGVIPGFTFSDLRELSLQNNKFTDIENPNIPSYCNIRIYKNKLSFTGLEKFVPSWPYSLYAPQDTILMIKRSGERLAVSAGGTLSNNTYRWYRNNQLVATIIGDSTMLPLTAGNYTVQVTNSIVTGLTLRSDTVKISQVKAIDPNPSLITTSGNLSTNISLLDMTAIVKGASADGITKVILYTEGDSPVKFWILNRQDGLLGPLSAADPQDTTVTVQAVNGKIAAVYQSPDGIGYTTNGKPERMIKLMAVFLNTNDTVIVDFKLITPPVVMVHGMWSGPEVWVNDGFAGYLKNNGFEPPFLANYSSNSFRTFDPMSSESFFGRRAVKKAILDALGHYRKNLNIACTQTDIVAHSLGGLMTRSLSQQIGSGQFVVTTNYMKGYAHKLITLGTPHRGSPFGPELWNRRNSFVNLGIFSVPVRISSLLENRGMKIGSCHKDFAYDSWAYKFLDKTLPFKTFSVIGDYTGETEGKIAMDGLCLWLFQKTLDEVMASWCSPNDPLTNDLIVPVSSQRGFITGGKEEIFSHTGHSPPGNNRETNSQAIKIKVRSLLLSNNSSEFGLGFPAPSSLPRDCDMPTQKVSKSFEQFTTRQATIKNQSIQITSPVNGSAYSGSAGTSITLSFEASGEALPKNSMFIVNGVGWYPVPDNPPYSVTISLPGNAPIGKVNILAIAIDSSGLRLADTSQIILTAVGNLDSIIVDPTKIELDSSIRQSDIYVEGYFSNNSVVRVVNLTPGNTGTIYSALKSTVFRVNENGLITAIAPGTDTLIISNGTKTLKVPVIVDANFLQSALYANSIDFPEIEDKTIGDAPFGLDASATSGENIEFSVISGPGTIENGILSMSGEGQITIKASQKGNVYFSVAPDIYQSFCVRPRKPSISRNCNDLVSSSNSGNQWYKDGIIVPGATSNVFTITVTGKYTLRVASNSCESLASNEIIITNGDFAPPPKITSPSTSICSGQSVTLSSDISSGNQWYKDGVILTDSTRSNLVVTESGSYTSRIVVNGCESGMSNSIIITIASIPPSPIITAGTATTFCTGGNVLLTSAASSGNQWYKDGIAISGSTGTTVNVTTSGTYTAKATVNGCESAISNTIIVTVNPIPVAPAITAGTSTTFCNGGSVILTSNTSTGNQWYRDGAAIGGSIGTTLNVTSSGNYTAKVISNGCESVVSNVIAVSVNAVPPTPTITQNGTQLISNATFGNQWFLNGIAVTGASSQNFTPTISGNYSIQVILNNCTSAFSNTINFIVTAIPSINIFDNQVKVMPNPVTDKLVINRFGALLNLNIKLYDSNGKLLKQLVSSSSNIEIDMSKYSSGAYIILIEDTRKKIRGKKVIVKM